jgi:hypothetical protein
MTTHLNFPGYTQPIFYTAFSFTFSNGFRFGNMLAPTSSQLCQKNENRSQIRCTYRLRMITGSGLIPNVLHHAFLESSQYHVWSVATRVSDCTFTSPRAVIWGLFVQFAWRCPLGQSSGLFSLPNLPYFECEWGNSKQVLFQKKRGELYLVTSSSVIIKLTVWQPIRPPHLHLGWSPPLTFFVILFLFFWYWGLNSGPCTC